MDRLLEPTTLFPLSIVAIALCAIAIQAFRKLRTSEMEYHRELRIREMEHQRKMKELEIELEKAKSQGLPGRAA